MRNMGQGSLLLNPILLAGVLSHNVGFVPFPFSVIQLHLEIIMRAKKRRDLLCHYYNMHTWKYISGKLFLLFIISSCALSGSIPLFLYRSSSLAPNLSPCLLHFPSPPQFFYFRIVRSHLQYFFMLRNPKCSLTEQGSTQQNIFP